jgi:hypothetical protein
MIVEMADASLGDLELDKREFVLSSANGSGHAATIAALLRQAADRLDELGDVTIMQIGLQLEPVGPDDGLKLNTVYRARPPE